jgi:hypothetical protein
LQAPLSEIHLVANLSAHTSGGKITQTRRSLPAGQQA